MYYLTRFCTIFKAGVRVMTEKQALEAMKNILKTEPWLSVEGFHSFEFYGVFIIAALHCGFRYKAYENSPNPCFNMSEASIKSLEKQYQAL
jgi:hypothetical protein